MSSLGNREDFLALKHTVVFFPERHIPSEIRYLPWWFLSDFSVRAASLRKPGEGKLPRNFFSLNTRAVALFLTVTVIIAAALPLQGQTQKLYAPGPSPVGGSTFVLDYRTSYLDYHRQQSKLHLAESGEF